MKKLVLILFGTIGLALLIGSGGVFYLSRNLDDFEDKIITEIDLSLVEDGTYQGNYEGGRFSNSVEIEVENNEIISITIIETVRFERSELTQAFIDRLLSEQTLLVDTEAGATLTSTAYLLSIENALEKGINNE